MRKNLSRIIALGLLGFSFVVVPRSSAGTDMIIDNSAQAPPPPVYNYAPPPRVYYAPPPVAVVVAPRFHYYAPGVRVIGVHRPFVRRVVRPVHHYWH